MRGWYIHSSTCISERTPFQVPQKPKKKKKKTKKKVEEGEGRTGVKSEGTIHPRGTGTSIEQL